MKEIIYVNNLRFISKQIWLSELEQFNHFCMTVFSFHWQSVLFENFWVIFTVYSNKRVHDLKLLFFLLLQDIKNGVFKKNMQLFSEYMKQQWSLSWLIPMYKEWKTRHSGFFLGLHSQVYDKVFDCLINDIKSKMTLSCSSWDLWAKIN